MNMFAMPTESARGKAPGTSWLLGSSNDAPLYATLRDTTVHAA